MNQKTAPISCREFASGSGQCATFDLVGPLDRSKSGFRYILDFQDSYSRKIWLLPLKDKSAREVAASIVKILLEHDVCSCILSDNAKEFRGEIMDCLCQMMGIKHNFSAVY